MEVHLLPYSIDRTTLCTSVASKAGPGPSNPLMTAYSASMWNIAEPAPMLYIDAASIREHALVLPLPLSTDRFLSVVAMTAREETGRRLRPAVPCHGIVLGAYFGARLLRRGAAAEAVGSSNPLLPWGQQALSLDHPVSPRRDRSSLTLHCASDPATDRMA